jgi:hypothetical protein
MGSVVGGRLYALLDTIIGNLQLKITNVHVRYEDSSSNPGHSFCIGVMLQEISATTANEHWRAAFVTAGALLTLRKVRGGNGQAGGCGRPGVSSRCTSQCYTRFGVTAAAAVNAAVAAVAQVLEQACTRA